MVSQTDTGMVRDHNEDFISTAERLGLAVLADGMGGMNAGEVASSMSVHLLMEELKAYLEGDEAILETLPTSESEDETRHYWHSRSPYAPHGTAGAAVHQVGSATETKLQLVMMKHPVRLAM